MLTWVCFLLLLLQEGANGEVSRVEVALNKYVLHDDIRLDPYFLGSSIDHLSIPPISGLVVMPWSSNETTEQLWIGRFQHSVLAIRSHWIPSYIIDGILSNKACQAIVSDSEKYATDRRVSGKLGWQTDRHPDHSTTDLPASTVYGDNRLHRYFEKYLLPILSQRYSLDIDDLYIADLFIVKYSSDTVGGQTQLKAHRDRSPFSFVVALNDDFDGGGTFFPQLNQLWQPQKGSSLIFHGQSLHGGAEVTNGTRYIVTGFVEYKNDSHAAFMKNYLPETDGTAALFGFRQGDIIRAIQVCLSSPPTNKDLDGRDESNSNTNNMCSSPESCNSELLEAPSSSSSLFVKQMVSVAGMSPIEWSLAAQSCEKLDPTADTVLIVERRSSVSRMQRPTPEEEETLTLKHS